jgi:hypothetical protein
MANFREAYRNMDIDEYRRILHNSFIFRYQDQDIQELNLPSDHHNRDEELTITQNMFSRNPIETPEGTVPGISEISFDVMNPLSIWEVMTDGDFEGSSRRLYYVTLNITRPGANTIQVEGQTEFFVIGRDSLHNGTPSKYWQLTGQVDWTNTGDG